MYHAGLYKFFLLSLRNNLAKVRILPGAPQGIGPSGGALQFEEAFVALFAALGSVGFCASSGWGHRGGGVNRVPVYVADCSNHASVQEVCEGYACFIPDLPPEEREGSCRGVGDPVAHLGQL